MSVMVSRLHHGAENDERMIRSWRNLLMRYDHSGHRW